MRFVHTGRGSPNPTLCVFLKLLRLALDSTRLFALRPDSTVLFVLRPRFYVIWPSRAPGWKNTARNQGLQKHSPKPKGQIQTLGGLCSNLSCKPMASLGTTSLQRLRPERQLKTSRERASLSRARAYGSTAGGPAAEATATTVGTAGGALGIGWASDVF